MKKHIKNVPLEEVITHMEKTSYICDYCGKESPKRHIIQKHEVKCRQRHCKHKNALYVLENNGFDSPYWSLIKQCKTCHKEIGEIDFISKLETKQKLLEQIYEEVLK